ncbi:hypothetical protein [Sinorhizobium sp. BG8]|uniref:hypothetical protein n=1 Tax=Sinorhizobium sp. BG8 TaxID=2613773 RepID=UPI00193DD786|nr:hypothetical protein [Sinorhizobium sp. BG8]QRM53867.1 hypothetical protein F3Y30_04330 [Sinorhizobium sp. BG8]
MLPYVATPNGQAVLTSAAPATAISNADASGARGDNLERLRSAVMLRLIETMLHHMQQNPDADTEIQKLLAEILTVFGTAQASGAGVNGSERQLAELLAKLPPETRQVVERLLSQAISMLPTRLIAEIIRNPNGLEARKLATLLLAGATQSGLLAGQEDTAPSVQRLPSLEGQLAAIANSAEKPAATGSGRLQQLDVRALQIALSQMFEIDGSEEPAGDERDPDLKTTASIPSAPRSASRIQDPASAGAMTTPTGPQETPEEGSSTRAEQMQDATSSAAEPKPAALAPPKSATVAAQLDPPVEAAEEEEGIRAVRSNVQVDEAALAPELPAEELKSVRRLISGIIANLSDDERSMLKSLLELPLPPETAPLDKEGAKQRALLQLVSGEAPEAETSERGTQAAATGEKAHAGAARNDLPSSAVFPQEAAGETQQTPPEPRVVHRQAADTLPEATKDHPVQVPARDGMGFATIPYLAAPEDMEERTELRGHPEEDETDEPAGDEDPKGEHSHSDGDEEPAGRLEEEDPDTQRRRQKITDLVGPPDPGHVFYQRLGDYWT